MKLKWLLSSILGLTIAILPVSTTEFVTWQFPANSKQLEFNVDRPVYDETGKMIVAANDTDILNSRILVTIYPGHGGKDHGISGNNGIQEAELSLSISKRVASMLESKGVSTKLTRTDDSFVELYERVKSPSERTRPYS
jgi:N-acetylmuramoyl-L-alanine amidase